MLILHGKKDERVPFEQAIGFRRALESAGLPFQMLVYPQGGHLFKETKHLIDNVIDGEVGQTGKWATPTR